MQIPENMPGAAQFQNQDYRKDDDDVITILLNLINRFPPLSKIILYRIFESLENSDNESKINLEKCEEKFKHNLLVFRSNYRSQKPLIKNIGFVAQRIYQHDWFREMFNRPKLPEFFEFKPETHARFYLLINHFQKKDVICIHPQEEEVKCTTFFVGNFYVLNARQNDATSLDPHNGVVYQNGVKLEPLLCDDHGVRFPMYILSNSYINPEDEITFSIAVDESYSKPRTLFLWFCVQNVSFNEKTTIKVYHGDHECICIPQVFFQDRKLCPSCQKPYQMSNVRLEIQGWNDPPRAPGIVQAPLQSMMNLPQQPPMGYMGQRMSGQKPLQPMMQSGLQQPIQPSQYPPMMMNPMKPPLSSQLSGSMNSQMGSQLNNPLVPQISSQMSAQMSSQISPPMANSMNSQMNPQIGSQMNAQMGSQMNPQMGRQMNPQMGNQMNGQVPPPMNQSIGGQMPGQPGQKQMGRQMPQMQYQMMPNQQNMMQQNMMRSMQFQSPNAYQSPIPYQSPMVSPPTPNQQMMPQNQQMMMQKQMAQQQMTMRLQENWDKLLETKPRPNQEEPPSVFSDQEYQEYWKEAGCEEIEEEINPDVYKNMDY